MKTNDLPRDYYKNIVGKIQELGLFPDLSSVSSSTSSQKVIKKKIVYDSFSSNNYLGLSDNPKLKAAIIEALKKSGLSSGSTRVLGGTHDLHYSLEKMIAEFVGMEDAMTFSTGYLTIIGTLPALINPIQLPGLTPPSSVTIFSDQSNHGSIHDAIKLGNCQKVIFKHNDLQDLVKNLKESSAQRKIIVTQGVFTSDGSIVPLKELIEIKEKFNALLFLDDADGIGVLGHEGKGVAEYFRINPRRIDIYMGTFTKAFGGFGGFIAADHKVVDYLRVAAKTNLLSAPMPPIYAAAMMKSIDLVRKMSKARKKIIRLADYLRKGIMRYNFRVTGIGTAVVLVHIGEEQRALGISKELKENFILATVVRYPAVPWGDSRLRFTINSQHTIAQLNKIISVIKKHAE